jgi:uncharacterized protein (DUF486 family)
MNPVLISIALLICSNVFMTFAWYAHLKELHAKPWIIAAFVSWGIALLEYLFQVPANRIGYSVLSVGQLKIMQEVINLHGFNEVAGLGLLFSIQLLSKLIGFEYTNHQETEHRDCHYQQ